MEQTQKKRKHRRMNSITKRWVRGSLLMTIAALLITETACVYFFIATSYDDVRQALLSRCGTVATQLLASDAQTDSARNIVLRRMVEQFEEKDKFEFMLMNKAGRPVVSTAIYVEQPTHAPEDFTAAQASADGTGRAVYHSASGEHVMAVTMELPVTAGSIVAVRMVTSLTLVDRSILSLVLLSLAVVGLIILFGVWSGMFFVRSIVRPIGEIEHTAAKIAKGNLDIRIENEYNDEIGKLAHTINHMAGELDKTERMKNEFISSVSHELSTPLTSIKGWVETISAVSTDTSENFRRGMQVIASETDRLYDMVEELLDFSRMQSGLKLDLHPLDLAAEAGDAVIAVEPRVHSEGLEITLDEPDAAVPVLADAARLRQVFFNVIDNAVKYSKPGGTIWVRVAVGPNGALCAVSDEGAGIAPEDLENVKIKFFKGRGAVRGSGIGLAVVDEIARAHGGSVDIASTLGSGTTVTLCLPLYDKNAPPPAQRPADEQKGKRHHGRTK